jgi:amphi-Trp domain-containing protein
MSEFTHQATETFTRQAAAEQLTAIAEALMRGESFEFTINANQLSIPIGEAVEFDRELKVTDEHVELDLQLSWSTAHATAPLPPGVTAP